MLSVATLLSRVMGLVREQVFAALLGAGFYGDAFTMAFRLPNLLRDLFAEGALSAAFQPAFIEQKKHHSLEAAYRLANLVMTVLLLVVGGLVLLGIACSPQLVDSWAAGYAQTPGKAELTVLLTRIMMPFLLLVSLAAVAMGMLNAQQRFVAPALAPALFNLATIVVGGLLWGLKVGRTRGAAIAWAVATLLGGALQLLAQEISQTIERARGVGVAGAWIEPLESAVQTVGQLTMQLAQKGLAGEVEAMLLHSADYLELFSILIVGWQWLLQAAVVRGRACSRRRAPTAPAHWARPP